MNKKELDSLFADRAICERDGRRDDFSFLAALLADHQVYHSAFQMDYFITGANGSTAYGMYKQALRELDRRDRALKHLALSRSRLLLKIRRERDKALEAKDECVREGHELNVREAQSACDELDRNVADTFREFRRFYAQAVVLKKEVGDLTPERRADLEIEYWQHHLKAMIAVELISCGVPSANTIQLIAALPRWLRQPLVEAIRDRPGLLAWFYAYEPPTLGLPAFDPPALDLPALDPPPLEHDGDIQKVLESS